MIPKEFQLKNYINLLKKEKNKNHKETSRRINQCKTIPERDEEYHKASIN